jgi:hypothetical protein
MEELTPKEMAKKLCEDFYAINQDHPDMEGTSPYISRDFARKCALVAVDALISETRRKYWYEVKDELMEE